MHFPILALLCLACGLSAALVAGVFQSFSDFTMRGLVMARPPGGAEAMRGLNVTVYRSAFLVMLLGLVPVSLAMAIAGLFAGGGLATNALVAAALIYIPFVLGVTMFRNVPMNRRLADLDTLSSEGMAYWATYGRDWTRWNHVRMAGSIATALCYLLAAMALS